MHKKDLVTAVAEATGETHALVNKVLDAITDEILEAVAAGKTVKISGFGNFLLKPHWCGVPRDPRTGERVNSPRLKSMRFKVSRLAKSHLNRR